MIRARIKALVRELLRDGADDTPDDTDDPRWYDGYAAACRRCADRLTLLLAEEEGGWRPDDAAIKRAVDKWFHHFYGRSFEKRMQDAILAAFNSPPPGARP